jgi:hypothetical protein
MTSHETTVIILLNGVHSLMQDFPKVSGDKQPTALVRRKWLAVTFQRVNAALKSSVIYGEVTSIFLTRNTTILYRMCRIQ